MKVAIMYSGGKDSTYAIEHAKNKGWDIRYFVSVKPNRTDCFLFHFATVENTVKVAEMLNIPHNLLMCEVADPVQEASLVKEFIAGKQAEAPINALILGGTGLQETQIRSLQEAMRPLGVEVFASHAGEEHDLVLNDMIARNYEIMITQVASDGLMPWLGKTLSKENFERFKADSAKFRFHVGGEGGYYDTLILDCPLFTSRLHINDFHLNMEDAYSGHVIIDSMELVPKKVEQEIRN